MSNFGFYYKAIITPTQISSDNYTKHIAELENSCTCEYYRDGKPVKRWKDSTYGHMDMHPDGSVIVITG